VKARIIVGQIRSEHEGDEKSVQFLSKNKERHNLEDLFHDRILL